VAKLDSTIRKPLKVPKRVYPVEASFIIRMEQLNLTEFKH
jgi:hypothetical protein